MAIIRPSAPHYVPSAPAFDPASTPIYGKGSKDVNLDDNCCICLEAFRDKAPNDKRNVRLLGETECNHFFHAFCLEEYLEKGSNKNCPLCRTPVRNINHLNLDAQVPSANAHSQSPHVHHHNHNSHTPPNDLPPYTHLGMEDSSCEESEIDLVSETTKLAADLGVGVISGLGSLGWSALKFGGSAMLGAISYGADAIASASEQSRQLAFRNKIVELFRLSTNLLTISNVEMQTNMKDVKLLLTAIERLPIVRRDDAQRSLDKLDKNMKMIEQKISEMQTNFKTFLNEEKINLGIRI